MKLHKKIAKRAARSCAMAGLLRVQNDAAFRRAAFSLAVFFAGAFLFAQTHASVPVDGKVYEILNIAELRENLCKNFRTAQTFY